MPQTNIQNNCAFCQFLFSSTRRLLSRLPPVALFLHQTVWTMRDIVWECFGQIEALEAGPTSLFSTVYQTTRALWSLVRDLGRNYGSHTIMSAILHSWVSWYYGHSCTAWQARLIAAEDSLGSKNHLALFKNIKGVVRIIWSKLVWGTYPWAVYYLQEMAVDTSPGRRTSATASDSPLRCWTELKRIYSLFKAGRLH